MAGEKDIKELVSHISERLNVVFDIMDNININTLVTDKESYQLSLKGLSEVKDVLKTLKDLKKTLEQL